jgi:formamidopyrimidine-DNA glycosylase
MPELPDIEAYCVALQRVIGGTHLLWIRINHPFLLRSVRVSPEQAVGGLVETVSRAGKRIVISLDNDIAMVLHLMIAGRLHWKPSQTEPIPPEQRAAARSPVLALFGFEHGVLSLTEAGTRRRASLHLVGRSELGDLLPTAIELLDDQTSETEFARALRGENHTVKRSLTDPRLFSGIGNSYSDEILFAARMSPFSMTQSLSDEEVRRLFDAAVTTLAEWRERFVTEAQRAFPGKMTAFREEMRVHGKFGKPCSVCGTPIQRIRYAENECNYCPACQTEGRVYADRALSRLLKSDWPRTVEELEKLGRAPE